MDSRGAVGCIQLFENRPQMRVDRQWADHQLFRDLGVGQPFCYLPSWVEALAVIGVIAIGWLIYRTAAYPTRSPAPR
jgi:Ni/Fe-hydrogenase subunit HybB-like protein